MGLSWEIVQPPEPSMVLHTLPRGLLAGKIPVLQNWMIFAGFTNDGMTILVYHLKINWHGSEGVGYLGEQHGVCICDCEMKLNESSPWLQFKILFQAFLFMKVSVMTDHLSFVSQFVLAHKLPCWQIRICVQLYGSLLTKSWMTWFELYIYVRRMIVVWRS